MKTSIEWTDRTWNPVRGCSRVSEGCRNCYAERIAARFSGAGEIYNDNELAGPVIMSPKPRGAFNWFAENTPAGPRWTGRVELVESKLVEPLTWRKPGRVFVNSMSDLFHENLPFTDILHVFQIMGKCPRQTFQILTKRPAKMRELLSLLWWRNLGKSREMGGDIWVKVIAGEQRPGDQNFLPNVWLGVSAENQAAADERIPELLQTPAAVRFVSYEPALGPVDFEKWLRQRRKGPAALDWGIIGGESGPQARPFDLDWAFDAVRQFDAADVPLFVKQLGRRPFRGVTIGPQTAGFIKLKLKDLAGGDPAEWPAGLDVRQFPRGLAV